MHDMERKGSLNDAEVSFSVNVGIFVFLSRLPNFDIFITKISNIWDYAKISCFESTHEKCINFSCAKFYMFTAGLQYSCFLSPGGTCSEVI